MKPIDIYRLMMWMATGVAAWAGIVFVICCFFAGGSTNREADRRLTHGVAFFAVLSMTLAIAAAWL